MADSMFNTNGSLSSTDPNVINAAMRATGGQILPSSPAFKRAVELSQLRNVQMQQGMAEGGQAVKNLQAYQAANPPTISGLPSNQVVTSDTGYKAVLDAQGNIVGTNAPVAPMSKFADERTAFNQGKGTMLEKAALGPNIRDAFLKEYAKKGPPVIDQKAMVDSFNAERAALEATADKARQEGPSTDLLRKRIAEKQSAAYDQNVADMNAYAGPENPPQPILGGKQSVASEMAKAAAARETEAKTAAVSAKVKKAEDAVRAAQATGKGTPAEVQKLLENFAEAQSEADALLLSPEEAKAKAAAARGAWGDIDVPGIAPKFSTALEAGRLGVLDAWRNYISNPVSSGLFGGPKAPLSKEHQDYLIYQENLQRAAGR